MNLRNTVLRCDHGHIFPILVIFLNFIKRVTLVTTNFSNINWNSSFATQFGYCDHGHIPKNKNSFSGQFYTLLPFSLQEIANLWLESRFTVAVFPNAFVAILCSIASSAVVTSQALAERRSFHTAKHFSYFAAAAAAFQYLQMIFCYWPMSREEPQLILHLHENNGKLQRVMTLLIQTFWGPPIWSMIWQKMINEGIWSTVQNDTDFDQLKQKSGFCSTVDYI